LTPFARRIDASDQNTGNGRPGDGLPAQPPEPQRATIQKTFIEQNAAILIIVLAIGLFVLGFSVIGMWYPEGGN